MEAWRVGRGQPPAAATSALTDWLSHGRASSNGPLPHRLFHHRAKPHHTLRRAADTRELCCESPFIRRRGVLCMNELRCDYYDWTTHRSCAQQATWVTHQRSVYTGRPGRY